MTAQALVMTAGEGLDAVVDEASADRTGGRDFDARIDKSGDGAKTG